MNAAKHRDRMAEEERKRTMHDAPAPEEDSARKYMLMGIDFALCTLGVDKDGLLTRFVRQEFQEWVQRVIEPTRGPSGNVAKGKPAKPARKRPARRPTGKR